MKEAIRILEENHLLKVIDEELDIYLEMPHIAYVEVKKPDSKAILFTNPVDKKTGKKLDTPVLMNVFCSPKAVELFIGNADKIAGEIEYLLKLKPPSSFMEKISMFTKLFGLKNAIPKRIKNDKAPSQEVVIKGDDVDLYDLPILTTWEQDGGPFITMGASVYTEPRWENAKLRYV